MRLPRVRFSLRSSMVVVALVAAIINWSVDRLFPPRPSAIVVGKPRISFGTVPQKTYVRHVWHIRNDGRASLKLTWDGMISFTRKSRFILVNGEEFYPGDNIEVPPGERAEISIKWATRDFMGIIHQEWKFATNDPKHPSLTLIIEGVVAGNRGPRPAPGTFGP